jgi:hypothetical protein
MQRAYPPPVLACFGLVVCSLGAAALVTIADLPALAGVLAFLAAAARTDIVVVAPQAAR